MYPNIDLKKTGSRMKKLIRKAGYSVRDIQEYLHLSCPQPIYRWFQGKNLPSVDHLHALSVLLGVHMEELLVPEREREFCYVDYPADECAVERLYRYYVRLKEIA